MESARANAIVQTVTRRANWDPTAACVVANVPGVGQMKYRCGKDVSASVERNTNVAYRQRVYKEGEVRCVNSRIALRAKVWCLLLWRLIISIREQVRAIAS